LSDVRAVNAGESTRLDHTTVTGAALRYWWIVLLIAAAFIVAVVGGTVALRNAGVLRSSYTARATLLVTDPASIAGATGSIADPQRYAADQLTILMSDVVIARALKISHVDLSTAELKKSLTVLGSPENDAIDIAFTSSSQETAPLLVESLIQAYTEFVNTRSRQSVNEAVNSIDSQIQSLQQQLQALQSSQLSPNSNDQSISTVAQLISALASRRAALFSAGNRDVVTTLSSPLAEPRTPKQANDVGALRLFSAGLLGLLIGIAFAYSRARRRPRFDRYTPAEFVIGAPLIARLSPLTHSIASSVPISTLPNSTVAEAIRSIAVRLWSRTDERTTIIHGFIGIPDPSVAGAVARNCAVALLEAGARVAVVDTTNTLQQLPIDVGSELAPPSVYASRQLPGFDFDIAAFDLDQLRAPMMVVVEDAGSEQCDVALVDAFLGRVARASDVVIVILPATSQRAAHLRLIRYVDDAFVVIRHEAPLDSAVVAMNWLRTAEVPVVGYIYDQYFPRWRLGRRGS
jgi:capsular polysaccharide biosynthesis protein